MNIASHIFPTTSSLLQLPKSDGSAAQIQPKLSGAYSAALTPLPCLIQVKSLSFLTGQTCCDHRTVVLLLCDFILLFSVLCDHIFRLDTGKLQSLKQLFDTEETVGEDTFPEKSWKFYLLTVTYKSMSWLLTFTYLFQYKAVKRHVRLFIRVAQQGMKQSQTILASHIWLEKLQSFEKS